MWVFEVSKKNFKVPFLFTVVKTAIQPLGYVWATSGLRLGYVGGPGLRRGGGLARLVAWPRGLASWPGGHPENDMSSTFFQLFGLPQILHRSNVFELEFCTVVPSVGLTMAISRGVEKSTRLRGFTSGALNGRTQRQ